MAESNAFLSTVEAARLLSVHPATLLRWVRSDRIPVVKFSRRTYRFRLADLEAWNGC